jgi:hypothetical protein
MTPFRLSVPAFLLGVAAAVAPPPAPVAAQDVSDHLIASVVGASGAVATGQGYRLQGTLGQAQVIGSTTGSAARHLAGFWPLLSGPLGASGLLPPAPVDALRQNNPNPFNPATTITFSLAREGRAVLEVHDVRGQEVATLVDDWLPAGAHTAVWTGRDDHGRRVPSGLYFCRLRVGGFESVRKMMLLK